MARLGRCVLAALHPKSGSFFAYGVTRFAQPALETERYDPIYYFVLTFESKRNMISKKINVCDIQYGRRKCV